MKNCSPNHTDTALSLEVYSLSQLPLGRDAECYDHGL
jgi:hypothetical protein